MKNSKLDNRRERDAILLSNYLRQELAKHPDYMVDFYDERKEMREAATMHNLRVFDDNKLVAHGLDSGGREMKTLCQILLDGELRHFLGHENYGDLGLPYIGDFMGHHDNGNGLFVNTKQTVRNQRIISEHPHTYTIPLELVEAVVLPTHLAEIVKHTFPSKAHKVKEYREYAKFLDHVSSVLDFVYGRRK
ncbi:MAG: hypothetical protein AABX10_04945 [Nanoarchaeota archaeon]